MIVVLVFFVPLTYVAINLACTAPLDSPVTFTRTAVRDISATPSVLLLLFSLAPAADGKQVVIYQDSRIAIPEAREVLELARKKTHNSTHSQTTTTTTTIDST